jgi:AraC-like DNA-binding protein
MRTTSRGATSAPPPSPDAVSVPASVIVLTLRERTRAIARLAFPRRRCRLHLAKTAADLETHLKSTLVDAIVLDISATTDDTWRAVEHVRDFPSIPFFALTTLRPTDAGAAARCATAEVADLLIEGVDDLILRSLVLNSGYSARFARALSEPPPALHILQPLQLAAWRILVAYAGRPVRTDTIAAALGVTREHLSRAFGIDGTANLKRLIDLVRLLSAAELAKNPGFDVGDVASILEFASSSHLSTTAQRIVGTRPASLARLRTIDLVERFVKGRTRSRG